MSLRIKLKEKRKNTQELGYFSTMYFLSVSSLKHDKSFKVAFSISRSLLKIKFVSRQNWINILKIGQISKGKLMFITILFLEENPHGIKILVTSKKAIKATVLLEHFSHYVRAWKGGRGSPKNYKMTSGGGGGGASGLSPKWWRHLWTAPNEHCKNSCPTQVTWNVKYKCQFCLSIYESFSNEGKYSPVCPVTGISLQSYQMSPQTTCLKSLNGCICKEVGGCTQASRRLSDLI